ncbi:Elongation factor G [uncultured Roseburia sp.]|uniref:TetM/TetW/TetO/TetS family tetracycline resistance ribosomal protection protein n=1 Tax=Brotonthovivens ammoniilytica TaxID=2981725 RepID=A0ABT2TMX3_9FIRM|nr:TetM/TetW/TetO/TetS family tetracycline resistance ribosomal protection protein [Brotonthovivens ammoniilytica]MCU6762839.1 TetM/TetW/TetO/TetS family tetracycline resistance ribosomal protection protein [Brotonthovivens ammoniilytica]SCI90791.1 Elongation factor G [uncultured Roseburia sp.]
MENTSENKSEKRACMGILAHVDAGKTTLAEAMLYSAGNIRKIGRVDHKDAFLDTYDLERQRGITIFSKEARMKLGSWNITLLDTPGHVDFSAEMERTLGVLDYGILVISGADGVQGHVQTLWNLLKQYQIPVFLFVNKMDQKGTDKEALLKELKQRLDERCTDFGQEQKESDFLENLALCDEALLEEYLEQGTVSAAAVKEMILTRKVFPCFFGSALKLEGVEAFLDGLVRYMEEPKYPDTFGARVYKISRDSQQTRLTHMKITGGSLKVKMPLTNRKKEEPALEAAWEEKADQIRIYSGADYEAVQEAGPGTVCAVTGLTKTFAGEGLGMEENASAPVLEPVLTYQILLPAQADPFLVYLKLKQLEEEDPLLHIVWKEQLGEIHAQVMGEVQIEILKNLILERFGINVDFGAGSIVYKETIADTVEGIGHFEPLRHYAEVHLLLTPLPPGSGLEFTADCSEEILDKNWQRLILTHLKEKKHIGVLTGSEITDMKITLAAGRAHQKHTEGGDFRQATYRALRQGLRKAESVLLEPVYEFRLEVPGQMIGRAMSDIQKMHGSFLPAENKGDVSVLTGKVPAAAMEGYMTEVAAYTKGCGRLFCSLKGYEPCHNADEVIAGAGYDADSDPDHPTGSVFCAHGAGYYVSWDQVEQHMHVDSVWKEKTVQESKAAVPDFKKRQQDSWASEKELEEIFSRTYGPVKRSHNAFKKKTASLPPAVSGGRSQRKTGDKEYLLVDGYNIIFAWDELKELAQENIEAARNKLMDILCNYQGYKQVTLILVFDAYKVKGNPGEILKYHNIHVVYTREAETADQYIEKTVHEIGRKYQVTVATSDALEQVIILGQGGARMSALGLYQEIEAMAKELQNQYLEQEKAGGSFLFQSLPEELKGFMEDVRLGKKDFL